MQAAQESPGTRKSVFPLIGLLLFLAGVAVGQTWSGKSTRADEPRLAIPAPPAPAPATPTGAETIENFKNWYYAHQPQTFSNTYWRGVHLFKTPFDAWVYQEIIHEIQPDLLIETGTNRGGSAYYFASLFDLEKRGRVLSVDIKDFREKPRHPRVQYFLGSSTSPEIVDTFRKSIRPDEKVMVSLDSDHHKDHVLKELQLYSPLVSVGSYVVVDDSIYNPNFPGAKEAVEEFLKSNSNFSPDKSREKYGFTTNPNSWLKRVR